MFHCLETAKKIKQITIKYGDRVVNVSEKPAMDKKAIRVESIEDVAKIADEISQPIFCLKDNKEVILLRYKQRYDVLYQFER